MSRLVSHHNTNCMPDQNVNHDYDFLEQQANLNLVLLNILTAGNEMNYEASNTSGNKVTLHRHQKQIHISMT